MYILSSHFSCRNLNVTFWEKLKPVAYGSRRRIKEISDCCYYIPVLETLTALMNNKQILEEVLKNSPSIEMMVNLKTLLMVLCFQIMKYSPVMYRLCKSFSITMTVIFVTVLGVVSPNIK